MKKAKVMCQNCGSLMEYKTTSPCVVCGATKEEIAKFKKNELEYDRYHIPLSPYGVVLVCKNHSKKFVDLISGKSNIFKRNIADTEIAFWPSVKKFNVKGFSTDYVCPKCCQKRKLQQAILSVRGESKIKDISSLNWQKYVKKSFPKIYNKKEHETFYLFLFDLHIALKDAYRNNDTKLIKTAFKFAEKSYRSKSYYISNAISTTFYEEITDFPISAKDLKLIPKDILEDTVIPLTKLMRPKKYGHLLKLVKEFIKNN